MILPIYIYGQPVLRQKAVDIDYNYPNIEQIKQNMRDTLGESDGIGLAAPQIGLSVRIVLIDLDVISDDYPEYKGFTHFFINPHIQEYDDSETESCEEGCLSLPGIHERVNRPTRIYVSYLDENFQPHEEWVSGYLARVMQHEFDHLEGKVFTDHIKGLRRQLVKSKLNDLLKGHFNCSYKVKMKNK